MAGETFVDTSVFSRLFLIVGHQENRQQVRVVDGSFNLFNGRIIFTNPTAIENSISIIWNLNISFFPTITSLVIRSTSLVIRSIGGNNDCTSGTLIAHTYLDDSQFQVFVDKPSHQWIQQSYQMLR